MRTHSHRRGRSVLRRCSWGTLDDLEPRVLFASTFTVTNTNDSGTGSLRAAITAANANSGLDNIVFAVGSGQKQIGITGALPTITDAVTIDGKSQPGYAGKPIIAIVPTLPASSASGLTITATGCLIQGLVISIWGTGVEISGGDSNIIRNCYIGTDFTGTQDFGNGTGVLLRAGASGNRIGGKVAADRNVISGNQQTQVTIQNTDSTNNVIEGNYIGLNAAGTGGVEDGVATSGIMVTQSPSNLIGGSVAGAGNVIAGFGGTAIAINEADGCTIQGNLIGTDATGKNVVDTANGIVLGNCDSTIIGGRTSTTRNVIAEVNVGISVTGNSNVIQGNLIGTGITGAEDFGCVFDGILIAGNNNTVGGTLAHAGNIISNNGTGGAGNGVTISLGSGNAIQQNAIDFNFGLGIDLGGDGVTQNDPSTTVGDSDNGPNGLQNFPVITSITSGATSTINGTLASSISTNFRIELFSSPTPDPTGFGEGRSFIGSANVTTDSSGNASWQATVPTLAIGQVITATATDSSGNTSEFSGIWTVGFANLVGGNLKIDGTESNDALSLSLKSGKVRATLNNTTLQFKASAVKHIEINLLGGNDSLIVGAGVMGVFCNGGGGHDNLAGGDNNDTLDGGGGSGKDTLTGGAGNDSLSGRAGNDVIFGGDGNDLCFGNEDNDYVDGGGHHNMIFGGTGNDQLFGGSTTDSLYGEAGDDLLNGGKGADYLDGGDGDDTAINDILDTRKRIEHRK